MSRDNSMITKRMIAQFYMDMAKYLLLLLCAYGLFDQSTQGTLTKPILIVVIDVFMMIAAAMAQCTMDKIDTTEKDRCDLEQ